jgi:hypothetical protein
MEPVSELQFSRKSVSCNFHGKVPEITGAKIDKTHYCVLISTCCSVLFYFQLKFMRQYGYLEQGTPDSEALYNEDAIIEAIKTVQMYGDIPQTGKLDNATLQVTNRQTDSLAK